MHLYSTSAVAVAAQQQRTRKLFSVFSCCQHICRRRTHTTHTEKGKNHLKRTQKNLLKTTSGGQKQKNKSAIKLNKTEMVKNCAASVGTGRVSEQRMRGGGGSLIVCRIWNEKKDVTV